MHKFEINILELILVYMYKFKKIRIVYNTLSVWEGVVCEYIYKAVRCKNESWYFKGHQGGLEQSHCDSCGDRQSESGRTRGVRAERRRTEGRLPG